MLMHQVGDQPKIRRLRCYERPLRIRSDGVGESGPARSPNVATSMVIMMGRNCAEPRPRLRASTTVWP